MVFFKWKRICAGFLLFIYICVVVGDSITRGVAILLTFLALQNYVQKCRQNGYIFLQYSCTYPRRKFKLWRTLAVYNNKRIGGAVIIQYI
jgi:hypothetical protein